MAQNTIADLSGTFSNNLDFLGQSMQGSANANTLDTVFQKFAALIARFYSDLGGTGTVGGTANAITYTSASTYQTLEDGLILTFKAASSITGAATFKLDSLTAKAIRIAGDVDVRAGDIVANGIYLLRYDTSFASGSGAWVLLGQSSTPLGTITAFAGASAPGGWLLCYGQAISRTTYAGLFAAISTTFGTGDGSTTFNVPDLRGRVPAGQDDMGGSSANRLTAPGTTLGGIDGDVLGATGGAETHVITEAQLARHRHNNETKDDNGGGANSTISNGGSGFVVSINTDYTGNDVGHNNVQPTIIVNYIIYAGA